MDLVVLYGKGSKKAGMQFKGIDSSEYTNIRSPTKPRPLMINQIDGLISGISTVVNVVNLHRVDKEHGTGSDQTS